MAGLEDPQIQIWLEQLAVDPVQDEMRAKRIADVLTLFAYAPDWLEDEVISSNWFENAEPAALIHTVAYVRCLDELFGSESQLPFGTKHGVVSATYDDYLFGIRESMVRFGQLLPKWFMEFFTAHEHTLCASRFKAWCLRYEDTGLDCDDTVDEDAWQSDRTSDVEQEPTDGLLFGADGLAGIWRRDEICKPEVRAISTEQGFTARAEELFREFKDRKCPADDHARPLQIWLIKDWLKHRKSKGINRGRWKRLKNDHASAGVQLRAGGLNSVSYTSSPGRTVSDGHLGAMMSEILETLRDEAKP